MTVVSDAYDGLRDAGFNHGHALRYLAREYGFDDQTMHRVLGRAGRGPGEKRERADSRRRRSDTAAPPSTDPRRRDGNPTNRNGRTK